MKYFLLCVGFLYLISCNDTNLSFIDCSGDNGNYKTNVMFGDYYYFRKYHIRVDKIFDKQTNEYNYISNDVFFKEHLKLKKDSTFSYHVIWEHYKDSNKQTTIIDTIEYMHGTFRIQPVENKSWHSFILESDTLFTKWKQDPKWEGNPNKNIVILDEYETINFDVNRDSILLNVGEKDSCFTLAKWDREIDQEPFYCPVPYKIISRKFCASSTYKDSSVIGVISE